VKHGVTALRYFVTNTNPIPVVARYKMVWAILVELHLDDDKIPSSVMVVELLIGFTEVPCFFLCRSTKGHV
jgi:hypothetical protein